MPVSLFRPVFRVAIMLFCVWHMAAVAIYSIPDPATDRVTLWFREHAQPVIRPYVLLTSQWQQWNLFSPDPQRRVTDYVLLEEEEDEIGEGRVVLRIDARSLRWWRKTDEIAMIGKWEDMDTDTVNRILERYLAAYCVPLGIPKEHYLRLAGNYAILPKLSPGVRTQWRNVEWTPFTSIAVSCADRTDIVPIFLP